METPQNFTQISDEEIGQFRTLFQSIRGIRPQTVDDLVDVVTKFRKNHTVLVAIEHIVMVLVNELKADASPISVNDVEKFYGDSVPTESLITQYLNIFDKVLSEKLDPDEKTRVMAFIRGFNRGTTTADIQAAIVSYLHC